MRWAVLVSFACQFPPVWADSPQPLWRTVGYEDSPRVQKIYKSPLNSELAGEFLRCTSDAGSRHELGDAIVRIDPTAIRIQSTPRVGSRTRSCLEDVARKLVELRRRTGWRVTAYLGDLPIGTPGPLFADSVGLLNAWRRYRTSPGMWRSWSLKRHLPDEVALRGDGCLSIQAPWYGANVTKSLDLWLAQFSPRKVSAMWTSTLKLNAEPGISGWFPKVYLVAPDLFLKVADGIESVTLCLDPISEEQRAALRRQTREVGTCLAGDLEAVLVSPRYAFPVTERASSVSTNGAASCAVGVSGTVTCCGPTSALTTRVPADRFRQVEVLAERSAACGVTTSGVTRCWGELVDQPPSAADQVCPHATCSVGRDGELALPASTRQRIPKAVQGHIRSAFVRPLDVACVILTTGALRCWDQSSAGASGPVEPTEWSPSTAGWDAVAIGPRSVCARNDVNVQCWESHGAHHLLLTTAALASPVVTSTDALCGLDVSGAVRCEHIFPDSQLPDPPPAHVVFKTLGEGGGLLCGADRDRRATCWGHPWPEIESPTNSTRVRGKD
jgi:hypothetical protein